MIPVRRLRPRGVICWLVLWPAVGHGVEVAQDQPGGMLGISVHFGTVRMRLGVVARAFYATTRVQANLELGLHYNFRAFGPPAAGPELRASVGGVAAWGSNAASQDVFLSPVGNQTGRRSSFAYAYNMYWDRIGTSQRTGTVALQIGALAVATENDILAGKGEDKFRTGAVSVHWREEDTRFGIRTVLWTGDTETNVPKVRESSYPSRFGYKDMRNARYGAYSHGLLTAQVEHAISGFQTVGAEVGVDWERVRHTVQNRFIHDMAFIPDGWVGSENPHVPMLDAQGGQYLFLDGQEVKPPRVFAELSTNPSLFY
jgi:hypothetical protein